MAPRLSAGFALAAAVLVPLGASARCDDVFFVHRNALSLIPVRATLQRTRVWLRFMIAAPKEKHLWSGFVIVAVDGERRFAVSTRVAALKPMTLLIDRLPPGRRRIEIAMSPAANASAASDAAFTTCVNVPGTARITRWGLIP
ncbi:MAG: hypothetical protein ACP5O6_05430 [Candidatus Baltobacteraceae bacterium]